MTDLSETKPQVVPWITGCPSSPRRGGTAIQSSLVNSGVMAQKITGEEGGGVDYVAWAGKKKLANLSERPRMTIACAADGMVGVEGTPN